MLLNNIKAEDELEKYVNAYYLWGGVSSVGGVRIVGSPLAHHHAGYLQARAAPASASQAPRAGGDAAPVGPAQHSRRRVAHTKNVYNNTHTLGQCLFAISGHETMAIQ